MPSYCCFRPIECCYSQSVSVSVPQDKIRGSAIRLSRIWKGFFPVVRYFFPSTLSLFFCSHVRQLATSASWTCQYFSTMAGRRASFEVCFVRPSVVYCGLIWAALRLFWPRLSCLTCLDALLCCRFGNLALRAVVSASGSTFLRDLAEKAAVACVRVPVSANFVEHDRDVPQLGPYSIYRLRYTAS